MKNLPRHAYFLVFTTKVQKATGVARIELRKHFFRWAIQTGRIDDPMPRLARRPSFYTSEAFARDPGAFRKEAVRYWRETCDA